jgi:hypothetical protein
MHGTATSAAEVTNISKHGFWLLLGDEELLLPFEHFPWFKSATVEQISNVERPSPNHLYWPPEFDTKRCKWLICIEATLSAATTARTFERWRRAS